MAYRNLSKRESVYFNADEANLLKTALIKYYKDDYDDADIVDVFCEIIVALNECIFDNIERDRKAAAEKENEENGTSVSV